MRLIESKLQSVPFADYRAVLLITRCRAITSSKYISIGASTTSMYFQSVAPLVGTRKKDTFQ